MTSDISYGVQGTGLATPSWRFVAKNLANLQLQRQQLTATFIAGFV